MVLYTCYIIIIVSKVILKVNHEASKNNIMKLKIFSISKLTQEEYNHWFVLMDCEKQKKVNKYRNVEDKKRTVIGEMLARQLISDQLNINPEEIIFEIGEFGKPRVKNLCVEFNISHSDDYVVCCISDKPIGVDIEKISSVSFNLINKICTQQDIDYIFLKKGKQIADFTDEDIGKVEMKRFYEIWTYKEAYFKSVGTGIRNLKSISICDWKSKRIVYHIEDYIVTILENDSA